MEIDIISLLSTDGYILCNKTLIKLFGGDCAILVGELCAEYNYYKAKGELTTEDSFYSTQENIEENTGLNAYQQRKALTVLKENGIITVSKQGLPAKNYYYINKDTLIKLFTPLTTSASNFKGLEVQNLNLNNNKTNNNNTSILSKDNIPSSEDVCSENVSETKQYTKEDYRDEFLGSAKRRKQPVKKNSLYSNCSKEITNYCISNNCMAVTDALHTYLSLRLSMKDKPIYNVAQWKAMLVKLDEVVSQSGATREEVINQSIEHGWASFYPPKSNNKRDVFSEYGQVTCEKSDGKESSGVEF